MDQTATLTGVLLLATLTEALVEYLVKPWLEIVLPKEDPVGAIAVGYVAAIVGILLCVAYRADLLTLANLQAPWPWIGPVITGILIGRGANFVHDLASRWLQQYP